jgi:hypothetical protein
MPYEHVLCIVTLIEVARQRGGTAGVACDSAERVAYDFIEKAISSFS